MRKFMMTVAAVAGVALVSGCKRENVEQERQDVAEAQQQAQEETAEIRQEAQQEVAETQQEAQQDIASAQQDVQEEQEDLAEAQRNQQEDLAQGGSGMAGASAQATILQGRVLSTGGDSLTLVDTNNNRELKLKTNDQTRITQNNRPVKLDDLEEGSQVRASYIMQGSDMVAREVTLLNPVKKQ